MNSSKIVPGKFGTRHVQFLFISGSMMLSIGLRVSLSVAIVAMTDTNSTSPNFHTYPWTVSEKSIILSSFTWGYLVMQIPSGYLAGMWSAHKMFFLGFFLSSGINVLTPLLADYGGTMAVCASRILMGVCQACYLPSITVLLSNWSPPQERSRLSAIISMGVTLGKVLAMFASGLIAASSLGWPGVFYVFGITNIIMSIAFYFFVADSPSVHSTISQEEKTYIVESLRQKKNNDDGKNFQPPWKDIFTSVPMWALIIVHFGSNWGAVTIVTQLPTYLNSVLKFDIQMNGFISSAPYLVKCLLSLPLSWSADYAIRKGVSTSIVRRVSNTIATWLPALFLVMLCFVDDWHPIWPITMLILAVGAGASDASGFTINHIDLSPKFAGTLFSISNAVASVAALTAPVLCGWIVQDSVDPTRWHTVFYITALIYFLSNLIFIIFGRGKVQPWDNSNKKVSVSTLYDPKVQSSNL